MKALDAGGRTAANPDLAGNIARVADRLKRPVASWADEEKLPELRDRDGRPVNRDATRYLLYRQSRSKEIVPDFEARLL